MLKVDRFSEAVETVQTMGQVLCIDVYLDQCNVPAEHVYMFESVIRMLCLENLEAILHDIIICFHRDSIKKIILSMDTFLMLTCRSSDSTLECTRTVYEEYVEDYEVKFCGVLVVPDTALKQPNDNIVVELPNFSATIRTDAQF